MILSCLVNKLRRFFINVKQSGISSCGKEGARLEQPENEGSLGAAEEKELVREGSLIEELYTALWPSRHSIVRMIPVKRKLEELELGADSSSVSQGRVRREIKGDDDVDAAICVTTQNMEGGLDSHTDETAITVSEIAGSHCVNLERETPRVSNLDAFVSFAEEFNINRLGKDSSCLLGITETATEDCGIADTSDCMSSESGKMKAESSNLKGAQFGEPEAAQKIRPDHCSEALCQEPRASGVGAGPSDGTSQNLDNGRHFHVLLQFFVKTYMDGRTIVLYGHASDTIESVHQQIFLKTGLPLSEQRLIYFGRQLQQDQTLADCHITNDATLHLVARMRSTALPHSWQLVNDLVATIRATCSGDNEDAEAGYNFSQAQLGIRAYVKGFLKMAVKSSSFAEHMQIFHQAGATSALVMLLLSPMESNSETAEESIRLFFCADDDSIPAQMHSFCVPVLLDFCKLLARSAPTHSLYRVCRNALACLVDTTGPVHGNSVLQDVKPDAIVHDFAPFVNELSISLCSTLQRTAMYINKGWSSHTPLYIKDCQDFTAFVTLLCKAFEALKESEASCSLSDECENDVTPMFGRVGCLPEKADQTSLYSKAANEVQENDFGGFSIGSKRWMQHLFQELLLSVDGCLEAIQPTAGALDEKTFWWAPLLLILKGLNSIARVHAEAAVELQAMIQAHQVTVNVLIKHSRWQDDHSWLFDYKHVLNFESKRKLAMAMLPEPQDDHEDRQEIAVSRSSLLSDSFEMLAYVEPDTLQGGISLEFLSEEATGPGVLREWFFLVCREIFNTQNALFKSCSSDGRRVFPNSASSVNPGHLTYFRFCGRVIALALMHRVQVNVAFSTIFFKQLAGRPISWEDTKDADPVFYGSCLKVMNMDAEEIDADVLGLTFVCEEMQLGLMKTVELCSGGKDLSVNSKNRLLYLDYLVKQRFVNLVVEQVKAFSQGFSELLSTGNLQQFLQGLEVDDFNLILHGSDQFICLDDWKLHTEYHEYNQADDEIIWFWEVLESMTNEQRRKVLFFSTSLRHLPAEGFAGLHSKFHIHKAHTDTSWLPTAHTCFFQFILPPYPSLQVMREKLHILTEEHVVEGFGFS